MTCAASTARSQEFNVPKFYASVYEFSQLPAIPPPPGGYSAETPVMVHFVHVYTLGFGGDAVQVARAAAAEILHRVHESTGTSAALPIDRIALNMIGLGHCSDDPSTLLYGNRLFTEADRLPGLNDDDGWPVPRDYTGPDYDDALSARAYRHPFLVNAGNGPLRAWCAAFINEYRKIQTDPADPLYDLDKPLPNPAMFIIDDESFVFLPAGNANGVFMLDFLYTTQNHAIWNTWIVPGNPHPLTGQPATLQQLYDYERQTRHPSWPAVINDFANGGISFAAGNYPSDSRHRPFMTWWQGICANAIDAVWKNSLYDKVHAAWPGQNAQGEYLVKCSNYGIARWDGVVDTTPWFRDRVEDGEPNLYPQPVRFTNNLLPRGFIHPGLGYFMYRDPTLVAGSGASRPRWWMDVGTCSADVDSPYLYWLRPTQWDPVGGWVPETQCDFTGCANVEGHKQFNPYRPIDPNTGNHMTETRRDSSLRIHEHAVRSSVRWQGGNHWRRLFPWLEPAGNDTLEDPYSSGLISQEDLRLQLAGLRKYNFSGGIFWPDQYFEEPSDFDQDIVDATAQVIYEVYAPRIFNFTRVRGTDPDPSPPLDADDPARLEFALLDGNGLPRRVEVLHDPSTNTAELVVAFRGLEWYLTNSCQTDLSPPCHPCGGMVPCRVMPNGGDTPYPDYYDYLLIVEDSTNHPDPYAYGFAFVWDFALPNGGGWVKVETLDDQSTTYGFYTPDRSSRRTFVLDGAGGRQFVTNDGFLMVKIVHTGAPSTSVTPVSAFDVVQLIPYRFRGPEGSTTGGQGEGGSLNAVMSDSDYSGSVSSGDLAQFLGEWFAQKAAADMNQDGLITEADLTKYLAAYATGT